jgi:hypothetical protein
MNYSSMGGAILYDDIGPTDNKYMIEIMWHLAETQTANERNKPQPVASGEAGLLDSN